MPDKKYKQVDGTSFSADTPDRVCYLLNYFRNNGTRIRVFYGDTKTGKDWLEEYMTMGRVGRSGGQIKIPILVNNSRSWGGGSILDNRIVRITVDKKDVYRHPKYHQGRFRIGKSPYPEVPWGVFVDGKNHANFKTKEKAEKWVRFMRGETNTKG